MLNTIIYQLWLTMTSSSAIAATLLGMIILRHHAINGDDLSKFKRAIALAFFSIAIEVVSRFIALLLHMTPIPTEELIICAFGRTAESVGLWGLIFYILRLWPFKIK